MLLCSMGKRKSLKWWCSGALSGAMVLLLAFESPDKPYAAGTYYKDHLQGLGKELDLFRRDLDDTTGLKAHLAACRREYKHVEFAVEYFYPFVARRMNGAALPETEAADPNEVLQPGGFQVIEEYVYEEDVFNRSALIRRELDQLQVLTQKLLQAGTGFTPANTFDALRLNLYRMAAKGLSGFDTPLSLESLKESAIVLHATREVLQQVGPLSPTLDTALQQSIQMLEAGEDFNGFDRARFLALCYTPLLHALYRQQKEQGIPFVQERRAIRPDAESFLSAGAFDPYYFAPPGTLPANRDAIALGAQLFCGKILSQGGRSCASCHIPSKAHTDGFPVNASLHGSAFLQRNTPTLLNVALQPALFYDSRTRYLEEQVREVVANRQEMAGQLELAVAAIRQDASLSRAFRKVFPKDREPVTEANLSTALAAYERSLTRLNSRFDLFLRGDTRQLSQQEQSGFNLFMGKARCGTCHYLPLFSGAVPPLYDVSEGEVIGVPANADTLLPAADEDEGIYRINRVPHRRHAFKTPGLRNIARTAPYMHNGVYRTLEEVIDFYDRGGGSGLGLPVPNQTLSTDRLQLTAQEKKDLVAFLKTLNDQ